MIISRTHSQNISIFFILLVLIFPFSQKGLIMLMYKNLYIVVLILRITLRKLAQMFHVL